VGPFHSNINRIYLKFFIQCALANNVTHRTAVKKTNCFKDMVTNENVSHVNITWLKYATHVIHTWYWRMQLEYCYKAWTHWRDTLE